VESVRSDGVARLFGRVSSRFGAGLVWVICLFDHGTVWEAGRRRWVPCQLVALAAYNIHARNVGARRFAARTGVE